MALTEAEVDHLRQRLESCAQVMMVSSRLMDRSLFSQSTLTVARRCHQAPPASVTAEQLNAAQAVFVEFQKMKQPFEVCRLLLSGQQSPYVKFQAASCLKAGVIRDWSYLRGGSPPPAPPPTSRCDAGSPGGAAVLQQQQQ